MKCCKCSAEFSTSQCRVGDSLYKDLFSFNAKRFFRAIQRLLLDDGQSYQMVRCPKCSTEQYGASIKLFGLFRNAASFRVVLLCFLIAMLAVIVYVDFWT